MAEQAKRHARAAFYLALRRGALTASMLMNADAERRSARPVQRRAAMLPVHTFSTSVLVFLFEIRQKLF